MNPEVAINDIWPDPMGLPYLSIGLAEIKIYPGRDSSGQSLQERDQVKQKG